VVLLEAGADEVDVSQEGLVCETCYDELVVQRVAFVSALVHDGSQVVIYL
jgi:hypothetical protein